MEIDPDSQLRVELDAFIQSTLAAFAAGAEVVILPSGEMARTLLAAGRSMIAQSIKNSLERKSKTERLELIKAVQVRMRPFSDISRASTDAYWGKK